jgi:hypothetical protein
MQQLAVQNAPNNEWFSRILEGTVVWMLNTFCCWGFYKILMMQKGWTCEALPYLEAVQSSFSYPGSCACNVLLSTDFAKVCEVYTIVCTALKVSANVRLSMHPKPFKAEDDDDDDDPFIVPTETEWPHFPDISVFLSCAFICVWCWPLAWNPNHAIAGLPPEHTVRCACAVFFLQTGCSLRVTHNSRICGIIAWNLVFHGVPWHNDPLCILHGCLLLLARTTEDEGLHEGIKRWLYAAYAIVTMLPSSWPDTQNYVMHSIVVMVWGQIAYCRTPLSCSGASLLMLVMTLALPDARKQVLTPWSLMDLNSEMVRDSEDQKQFSSWLSGWQLPQSKDWVHRVSAWTSITERHVRPVLCLLMLCWWLRCKPMTSWQEISVVVCVMTYNLAQAEMPMAVFEGMLTPDKGYVCSWAMTQEQLCVHAAGNFDDRHQDFIQELWDRLLELLWGGAPA